MTVIYRLSLCALLVSLCMPSHADIYLYVDEHGMRHFTDVPGDARYRRCVLTALILKIDVLAPGSARCAKRCDSTSVMCPR